MAETTNDISSSGKESFCMFNGSGTYGYLAEEAIGYCLPAAVLFCYTDNTTPSVEIMSLLFLMFLCKGYGYYVFV